MLGANPNRHGLAASIQHHTSICREVEGLLSRLLNFHCRIPERTENRVRANAAFDDSIECVEGIWAPATPEASQRARSPVLAAPPPGIADAADSAHPPIPHLSAAHSIPGIRSKMNTSSSCPTTK